MVAVINSRYSLRSAVYYNEQKVNLGKVQCLSAGNYPKDVKNLSVFQKLKRLTNQANLNEIAKRNSVHISLNFHPSDQLDNKRLAEIGELFMNKIGFGRQPYLVYVHLDAGHPHIHIVTTNIQANGKRIEQYKIWKVESLRATKEIEQQFNLAEAKNYRRHLASSLKPYSGQKIKYGKMETVSSVSAVLSQVLNSYQYTSLSELNALLGLYNLLANRGSETSRIFKNRGLVYRILDENGKIVGVPIKASILPEKPMLSVLERKFEENRVKRPSQCQRIKSAVDWSLLKAHGSLGAMINSLKNEQIDTVFHRNKLGFIDDINFIDHRSKVVFRSPDLGEEYSIKRILERSGTVETHVPVQKEKLTRFQLISKADVDEDTFLANRIFVDTFENGAQIRRRTEKNSLSI
jgi:hypothetical protein